MVTDILCVYCHADMTDLEWEDPCPACGKAGKSLTNEAAWDYLISSPIFGFEHKPAEHPNVVYLWRQTLRRIERVRKMCEVGAASKLDDVMDEIDAMLVGVFHISDWLHEDTTIEPRITKQDVSAHIAASPNLAICRDYANSYKHLHRGNEKYARAEQLKRPAHGAITVTIAYWQGKHRVSATSVEVLKLAEDAMAEWRFFLNTRLSTATSEP